jgi:hypothetical protein
MREYNALVPNWTPLSGVIEVPLLASSTLPTGTPPTLVRHFCCLHPRDGQEKAQPLKAAPLSTMKKLSYLSWFNFRAAAPNCNWGVHPIRTACRGPVA